MERFLAIRNGTGIAPDDRWTQNLLVLIHTNQTMHLIRNTNSKNILTLGSALRHNFLER